MDEKCCCCSGEKHTERNEEQKKKLMNRLSRLEGQIRGLKTMIEEDKYCGDILVQAAAASAALSGFEREVLAAHMHSCVIRDIKDGKDDVVDELMDILQKMMK
ncbi:MAG: metal-sensing transcriptional repressor [Spirochaetales bacterium]|nr:metal-sensing transcriptional repressor [Candidatus Physcosoma equi]